jgi:hypothetical protein
VHDTFLDFHAKSFKIDGRPTQYEQFVNPQSGAQFNKGHDAVGFRKQIND